MKDINRKNSSKRNSLEIVRLKALKRCDIFDSSSNSSSAAHTPNIFVPPRVNNPILDNPQFRHHLPIQLESLASINELGSSSSSTPNSFSSFEDRMYVYDDTDEYELKEKWKSFPIKQPQCSKYFLSGSLPVFESDIGTKSECSGTDDITETSDTSEDEIDILNSIYSHCIPLSKPIKIKHSPINFNSTHFSKTPDN